VGTIWFVRSVVECSVPVETGLVGIGPKPRLQWIGFSKLKIPGSSGSG
jgi:hypothetical protein